MTRATAFTLQLLATSALALVLGAGSVHAQMGSDARSNDRKVEKQLDDRALTPIRPIRRVGPDSWPDAKPAEQQAAQQKKDEATRAANSRETTGQTAGRDASPGAAQNPLNNQAAQGAAEPAKPDASKQQAAEPKTEPTAAPKPEPGRDQQDTAAANTKDKGAASIRLGTDANGKVAINDDQERQISRVMRRHNVRAINPGFDVKVGAAVPRSVQLAAVSSDLVDILPQFRGYSYFATRETIVIVEPSDMKVIALIPVAVGGTAVTRESAPPPSSKATVRETSRNMTRGNAAPDMRAVEAAIERDIRQRNTISETAGTTVYRAEPVERTVIIERRRGVFPWW
jgi:hypothetical protein